MPLAVTNPLSSAELSDQLVAFRQAVMVKNATATKDGTTAANNVRRGEAPLISDLLSPIYFHLFATDLWHCFESEAS
jgi:hypothetical protein